MKWRRIVGLNEVRFRWTNLFRNVAEERHLRTDVYVRQIVPYFESVFHDKNCETLGQFRPPNPEDVNR